MWSKEKQIILGPYGSGITELLQQFKAADLTHSGQNVLVILLSHLMMKYTKFLTNMLQMYTLR